MSNFVVHKFKAGGATRPAPLQSTPGYHAVQPGLQSAPSSNLQFCVVTGSDPNAPDANAAGAAKTFVCRAYGCSSSFFTSSDLKTHSQTHKVYKCDYPECDKAFASPAQLKSHRYTHTGERPFACEHAGCGQAFVKKWQLRDHTVEHTGQPLLVCNTCGRKYSDEKEYIFHMKHGHSATYECKAPNCGQRFPDEAKFNQHAVIHQQRMAPTSSSRGPANDHGLHQLPSSAQPTQTHFPHHSHASLELQGFRLPHERNGRQSDTRALDVARLYAVDTPVPLYPRTPITGSFGNESAGRSYVQSNQYDPSLLAASGPSSRTPLSQADVDDHDSNDDSDTYTTPHAPLTTSRNFHGHSGSRHPSNIYNIQNSNPSHSLVSSPFPSHSKPSRSLSLSESDAMDVDSPPFRRQSAATESLRLPPIRNPALASENGIWGYPPNEPSLSDDSGTPSPGSHPSRSYIDLTTPSPTIYDTDLEPTQSRSTSPLPQESFLLVNPARFEYDRGTPGVDSATSVFVKRGYGEEERAIGRTRSKSVAKYGFRG